MRVRLRAALAGGFAAVIGWTSTVPAIAAATDVSVGSGTLVAKGAAVTVPTTFVCDTGQIFNVFLVLRQRVGNGLAVGAGGSGPYQPCTGETQTVAVTVTAQNRAFKPGTAAATLNLQICQAGFVGCDPLIDLTTEIRLRSH